MNAGPSPLRYKELQATCLNILLSRKSIEKHPFTLGELKAEAHGAGEKPSALSKRLQIFASVST